MKYDYVQVAGIIGFDTDDKINEWQSELFLDKKEACDKLLELQIKEYEKLKDSVNADDFTDSNEIDDAHNALDDFYFDSMMGLKLSGSGKPKYYQPKKFKIMTFILPKELVKRIAKGEGYRDIYQLDMQKKKQLKESTL